ncbi:extracellular solute-binding protein [Konateibacter massiliensis]|uniref:extracellular solute-binding protein n=1 Tax=Konateibacter massiliensis TaxID=2002841 RepID=UPI000C151A57|nr:extracellular solute-binding protein [Konateibacter massiliensis]
MKTKKYFSGIILMIALLIVTSLAGCKSKETSGTAAGEDGNQETKNEQVAMGRYMEEAVTLPDGVTGENMISVLKGEEDNLIIYTREEESYYSYTQQTDDSFTKEAASWLETEDSWNGGRDAIHVFYGEDGGLYAFYSAYGSDIAYTGFLKASDDRQSGEALNLAYLQEIENETEGLTIYPTLEDAKVLKNGNIVITDATFNGVLILDPVSGEKIGEVAGFFDAKASRYSVPFDVEGNNIILAGTAGDKIVVYNTETEKTEREIAIDNYSGNMTFHIAEDGTIYIGDTDGITKVSPDGTLWENIVDGALCSLSMPSISLNGLVQNGEENGKPVFYSYVYDSSEGGGKILKYTYDSTVPSVPDKELTIYSLTENSTIRQAIAAYQRENTDVKITYNVAMADTGSGTAEDYVKALNTELLAGKGADIILLDGLPKDSYIEKGVLEDISFLISPKTESGELSKDMLNAYMEDGKLYAVPTRFSVPLLYGREEALSVASSVKSLEAYMDSANGEKVLSVLPDTGAMVRLLLNYYYADVIPDAKTIDKEALQSLLEIVKMSYDSAEAGDLEEVNGIDYTNITNILEYFEVKGELDLSKEKTKLGVETIKNIMDMMMPFEVIKNGSYEYSTLNNSYIPLGIMGINSASQDKELAGEFLTAVLSEEVQSANLYDGFPLNQNSLKTWFEEQNDNLMVGFSLEGGEQMSATWPQEEYRNGLYNKVLTLAVPIEYDQVLIEKIVQLSAKYYIGESSIEETVNEIQSGISTYLAE